MTHSKNTTMVASFITSPPLERALVDTEGDRKKGSPLSIGSELNLIPLRKRLSFVFPVSKVGVRSVVDFCNERIAYARWNFERLFRR